MRRRQPQSLPRLWLFTDERVPDNDLIAAITHLPKGSGIVFRHYGLASAERRALIGRISLLVRRRGLVLLLAGERTLGQSASGYHNPSSRRHHTGLATYAAHNAREIAQANRRGADMIFLSPVFPTRSHPGAPTLGPMRFAALARLARCPVIALGGMNASRFRHLKPLGAYGWAAIDALT
ncbi:MAG: thiamine phosphate synthase [Sphingomonadaceae bacterium]